MSNNSPPNGISESTSTPLQYPQNITHFIRGNAPEVPTTIGEDIEIDAVISHQDKSTHNGQHIHLTFQHAYPPQLLPEKYEYKYETKEKEKENSAFRMLFEVTSITNHQSICMFLIFPKYCLLINILSILDSTNRFTFS